MDPISFLAGVCLGAGVVLVICLIRCRPPAAPDDGMVLEFVLGEPREQSTPTKESR